jgi:Mn2+/Fe2+ NRAMP family transporter
VARAVVGALINLSGINPIDALFWTAVLNGIAAPPLLVLIMLAARDPRVMGGKVIGRTLMVLGWAARWPCSSRSSVSSGLRSGRRAPEP